MACGLREASHIDIVHDIVQSMNAIQLNTVVSLRMRFFPQNFGTIKRILPGSSSPSHREGPGIEVVAFIDCNTVVSHCACDFFPKFWNDKMNFTRVFVTVSPRRSWDRGWQTLRLSVSV